ncbi:MAG: hypothetical protein GY806_12955, partial [Gammaproteobacteria bacterium]|nr:hypothetical protein [Gammaproteobacteria bacterium]
MSLAQPAMAADDVYEENDTLATATPLTENTELSAIAANGDDDWYKIVVGSFVDLAQIQVVINFNSTVISSVGLYDDSGNYLTSLVANYVGADNSTYYLRITSFTAGETGYTVKWSANNLSAINLSENTSYSTPGTPTGDDWYKIQVDSCDNPVQILIDAQFSAASSNRSMELYDTSGNSLYSVGANSVDPILDYVGPKPNTPTIYYIRVDAVDLNQGYPYSLQWNDSDFMPCDGARFFGILPYGGRWYDVSQEGTKLCWAAAGSNFLHWTEWRECSDECFPPSSVTLLFDEFEASWDDAGNLPYYGWYWYFNGDT